ncbi:putative baseplate assembly protein [Streptomyces pseudogriseolus]|uniref:putative baseplate assembly protein n=1 Tax=Streptomyces pseudogriseolus TaxID=36817 RepID=UPI003FA2B675
MSVRPLSDGERRRAAVRAAGLAGIESVSVGADRRSLTVLFFGTLPEGLDGHSFRIEGGRGDHGIRVVSVTGTEDPANCLTLELDRPGEEFDYRLHALGQGFDRCYDSHAFSFRQAAPETAPPKPADGTGPLPPYPAPAIDYLAKDYASFRRLLFERLALTMPEWTERHAPDLGVTLVELLAHVGDQLSYQQDAVATEAYLDTARLRTSVRRHARLVDYPMHDGCAARTFVCVETSEQLTLRPDDLAFTAFPPDRIPQTGAVLPAELLTAGHPLVYRPLERRTVVLRPEHNSIGLWTWGDQDHCLPAGTTRATLLDARPRDKGTDRPLLLAPGDVIVLEEIADPWTGSKADRDPSHRQAVRLTKVTRNSDALYDTKVLDVEWADEDALAFPLRVTARCGPDRDTANVAVARGNVVLVEHGIENTWCPGSRPETVEGPAVCGSEQSRPGAVPAHTDRRSVPIPEGTQVTRAEPYPRPADVSAGQSRQLSQLAARARARLADMRQSDGPLSSADLRFLETLFEPGLLYELRGDRSSRLGLTSFLRRFDEYLERKLRRLEALAARARSGYVLDPADTGWELAQTWGQDAPWLIDPDNPALHGPASAALRPDPREALPAVRIRATGSGGEAWTPRRDLLASGPRDCHVVGETDEAGRLNLRFGDGRSGAAPLPGEELLASYRTGGGRAGNVGSEAINRIASRSTSLDGVTRVRNPLPATGGVDPEPVAQVRLAAPRGPYRKLLRAVTAEDYETLAGRHPGVQRAAAVLRWTGSWYEADVALDAQGTSDPPDGLSQDVRLALHRFRRIGHDVVTGPARRVPLDVALTVFVDPDHLAGHVRQALLRALRPGPRPGGGRGFFDPDVLTFGTPVRASALVAAAAGIPGVRHVQVTRLRRLHRFPGSGAGPGPDVPPSGVLRLRPLEIARLDGDSTRPENGWLTLDLRGGR